MKLGDLICVKKYLKCAKDGKIRSQSDILINALKDYYAEPELVFSPEAYDLSLISSPNVNEKHRKGYTMHRFFPAKNGEEIVNLDWSCIFRFMCDLFEGMIKLFDKGICMLDFKLENTLLDDQNKQGRYIDMGGAVYKFSRQELIDFHVDSRHYEYSESYSSPEINSASFGSAVNLCQAMAYNFGKALEFIEEKEEKNKKKDCPDQERLRSVITHLLKKDVNERWSVEQGYANFKLIGSGAIEKDIDLTMKINDINQMIKKNRLLFREIDENLSFDSDKLIPIYVENSQEEIKNKEQIEIISEKFLSDKNIETKVLLLIGMMGAGKSSFLNRLYLQTLKQWKYKNPFPFYLNLADKATLKDSFERMVKDLEENFIGTNLSYDFPFTLFTREKYPMVIFLDSFDKAGDKRNVVSGFYEELHFNLNVKFVVTSREDYFKSPNEITQWFEKSYFKCEVYRFLPLNFEDEMTSQMLEKYLKVNDALYDQNTFEKTMELIQDYNLLQFMRTPLQVKMNAKIIPELHEKCKNIESFSLDTIYEEYAEKIINENKLNIDPSRMEKMLQEFKFNPNEKFYDQYCSEIAQSLHLNKGKIILKIDSSQDYRNLPMYTLSRMLKSILNFHFSKGEVSYEFDHDFFLIHYLVKGFETSGNFNQIDKFIDILSKKKKDKSFISYFIETLQHHKKQKKETIKLLKAIVFHTRENKTEKAIKASSNAMTILAQAHISFVNKDLRNINITGADLSHGIFSGSDFRNSNLSKANLTGCKLDRCFFIGTSMKNVIFTNDKSTYLNLGSPVIGVVIDGNNDNEEIMNLVVACENGNVYIVDLICNQKQIDYNIKQIEINFSPDSHFSKSDFPFKSKTKCLAISKDGQKLITGKQNQNLMYFLRECCDSEDKKRAPLKFYDILSSTVGHYPTKSISFSNDGRYIVEMQKRNLIKIWISVPYENKYIDKASNVLCMIKFGDLKLNCQMLAFDNSFLLIGATDGFLYMWSKPLESSKTPPTAIKLRDFTVSLTAFCSSMKDWLFLVGDKNGGIHSFEIVKKEKDVMDIKMGPSGCTNCKITTLLFIKQESCFLSGEIRGRIILWLFNFSKSMVPLKYFDGHETKIISLHTSKFEDFIISSSSDSNVRIWKIGDIHQLKSSERHTFNYGITTLDVSDDITLIATGGADGKAILHSGDSQALLAKFEGHKKAVKSVVLSQDKAFLVTAGVDGNIKKWDRKTGRLLFEFGKGQATYHMQSVNAIVQSKDGKFLVSGSDDCIMKLWDFANGHRLFDYDNEGGKIKSICFSPDCHEILTGDDLALIKIWKLYDPEPKAIIIDNYAEKPIIHLLSFPFNHSKDKKDFIFYFVSYDTEQYLKIWSTENKETPVREEKLANQINSIDISSDGKLLITADNNKKVMVWEVQNGEKLTLSNSFSVNNLATALKHRNNKIFLGCNDGNIQVFKNSDKANAYSPKMISGHCSGVNRASVSPNGKFLLSGGQDKKLIIREELKASFQTILNDGIQVTCVCFSWNSKMFSCGDEEGRIKLFRISSNSQNWEMSCLWKEHSHSVTSLSISKDNLKLLSGGFDEKINMFDIENGCLIKQFSDRESVTSVSFLTTSDHFISSNYGGSLAFWFWDTNIEKSERLQCHDEMINIIVVSPDLKFILTGSADKKLKLWDIYYRKMTQLFNGHTDGVVSACFSLDGEHILSGGDDHNIIYWNRSGEVILTYHEHNHNVTSVMFLPTDCTKFISSSLDKTIKIWKIGIKKSLWTIKLERNEWLLTAMMPSDEKIYCQKTVEDVKENTQYNKEFMSSAGSKCLADINFI